MLKVIQQMADVLITQLIAVTVPEMSQDLSLEDGSLRAIIALCAEHLQSSELILNARSVWVCYLYLFPLSKRNLLTVLAVGL